MLFRETTTVDIGKIMGHISTLCISVLLVKVVGIVTTDFKGVLICFFFFGATVPQWAMASSFTRFLDHTQRRTSVGRTALDE